MTTHAGEDLARRLDELAGFVIELAAGRLDARLDPSNESDEIDAIVVGLNMLAEELQGLTHDLEGRVTERTRELADAHAALELLAHSDPLTGLANRTLLGMRLRQVEQAGTVPAVLVLDLDGFKAINDSFGHEIGDELLVAVAERLRGLVRESDTVARLGGDEFAILVQDATPEQTLDIAERIRTALAAPVVVQGRSCWVSASIGVRLGAGGGGSTANFLRDADTAMYIAKGRARGGVSVFAPAMRREAQARSRLADELRTALTTGQLLVLYQPIVDLETGRVAAVEALARWRHPERGFLTPDMFLSVAEDTGLITALDMWVLETAAAQVARWRRDVLDDEPFSVHVNVSPVELRAPGFVDGIVDCTRRHGLRPQDVTIEITEHRLLGEDAATREALEGLREAEVGVAIDDFGTGSSSLGYARRAFVDEVKIDRSLVTDLDVDDQQMRVTAAILVMAHAFDLIPIAEGVQTESEAHALRTLGCRYGQGYFWSPPVPATDLEAQIRTRNA
ncbi:putative bifunctional diguanylate cyclase/phosphodiesterase [Actinomycetospora termitidis]|uniref:EAL domain-containing protein n=1 Tax=Actinomycetospora termitidis TaxID=3053470 RepID=A0ABT7MFR4_9PSEU|nr:EAL domain-containing protein [Actinomycetospora sp. Odt1-22]MDL5159510.1 EAL domain-containing protein [Actinomycetospora sp. Odt1-22]